jgi:hypothetical protein
MRKILISTLIFVFISATAFAGGGKETQNRNSILGAFNSELCSAVQGKAKVHEYGVRFTVTAAGCTPGHVISLWTFDSDGSVGLNCGGGIVLPNGQYKTICDVPMGVIEPCLDCAQVLGPDSVLGDPRDVSFEIHMVSHNALVPDRVMSQIRTINTCGTDACTLVTFLFFPAP